MPQNPPECPTWRTIPGTAIDTPDGPKQRVAIVRGGEVLGHASIRPGAENKPAVMDALAELVLAARAQMGNPAVRMTAAVEAQTRLGEIHCGDCLEVMRDAIPDESIDLIYLDPPFCTGRDFGAFDDRWHGGIVEGSLGKTLDALLGAIHLTHGAAMQSYIGYMAARLLEMRRVLKVTGSLYLHCDPFASHYLKMLMDAIFGRVENFRNEIVWCYRGMPSRAKKFQSKHDGFSFMHAVKHDYPSAVLKVQPCAMATLQTFESGRTRGQRQACTYGRTIFDEGKYRRGGQRRQNPQAECRSYFDGGMPPMVDGPTSRYLADLQILRRTVGYPTQKVARAVGAHCPG